MPVLSTENLSKSYGAVDIFSGLTLSIPKSSRIAVVGPNGVGKTTLLRILVGLDEPSAGRVMKAKGLTTGYLPQEAQVYSAHSLWEECLLAIADLLEIENELTRLESSLGDEQRGTELLEKYGALQIDFERRGGYVYETKIRQILSGLGFREKDFMRPLSQLSGGQRTRAVLARLLLEAPGLLILDEPTNHLDIRAVEWLENYFNHWDGAVLIVSHDRYFLDRVVDTIWEMSPSGIEIYHGNYSAYTGQRVERWDLRQQIFESEKARMEKEIDYIKRNIAGQRTTHAHGKLKRLSREIEAIEKLGFDTVSKKSWSEISQLVKISDHEMETGEAERRINELRQPHHKPADLKLHLKTTQRSGDLVIRTRDLVVGYADEGKPLFMAPDLLLKRGECAAVIGPNGAGKTTFLKTLLGHMPPLGGELILGASLSIGYFAQAHEGLNPENTLVEEIEVVAPQLLLAEIRNYLARYLFSGDDVFKRVETLSGGERGRLALAKLSLENANLLLLDEPTNHLDIPSQEILQEVLADYTGTMLLVSHDRYLIDALASWIWAIVPERSTLEIFEGNYSGYREFLTEKTQLSADQKGSDPQRKKVIKPHRTGEDSIRKRQIQLENIEQQIEELESQLSNISNQLDKAGEDVQQVQELGLEYVRLQKQVEGLIDEWETLNS